jgi:hypothetical protein
MKKVAQFNSQSQAHLATQTLLSHGIKSELIGSKDYSSIIVGSDMGKYELMVDWQDEAEALRIVKEVETKLVSATDLAVPTATSLLKKSISLALLACVFVPVVLNYASLKVLKQYWQTEPDKKKKIPATILVILLQLPTFIFSYLFIRTLF